MSKTVRSCIELGTAELKALHDAPYTQVPGSANASASGFPARTSEARTAEDSQAIRRLESEVLLAFVLGKNHSWLYAWPEYEITAGEFKQFQNLLAARIGGKPVAYLTGYQEFWSLDFRVTPDVLIPRADTELLVEVAIERLQQINCDNLANDQPNKRTTHRVLELGTGSGAIAIAIATAINNIAITATDISSAALAVARSNAQRLLGELITAQPTQAAAIEFIQSDWFKELDTTEHAEYALVVSNPPYICPEDPHLTALVTGISFEPETALVAADNGLQALRTIIKQALPRLMAGGWLALEHGHDQAATVRQLFLAAGYLSVQSRTDLSGVERVTLGRCPDTQHLPAD